MMTTFTWTVDTPSSVLGQIADGSSSVVNAAINGFDLLLGGVLTAFGTVFGFAFAVLAIAWESIMLIPFVGAFFGELINAIFTVGYGFVSLIVDGILGLLGAQPSSSCGSR